RCAARALRKKARRFPGAQSRRSCNDDVSKCVSGPAGVRSSRETRRVDSTTPLLVSRGYQGYQTPIRLRLRGRTARLSRSRRAPADAQHPSSRKSSEWGLDSSSVSVLAAHALGEKNQRLAAFTGVPGRDFNGPVPDGCYADETPYVEAIRKKAGNIDVDYVHTDACDDFAQLERFFIALDGPVRNPTNFGWAMAILQRARA